VTPEALELKRLEALAQAFRLLSPLTTREEVYARTVQALKASTRAASALLFLYRPERDELELVAAAGLSAPRVGLRLKRGRGISWAVLEKGEPLFLPDVSQDPRVVFLSGTRQAGAYLGVPLRSPEGQVLGVLSLDTAGGWGRSCPRSAFWPRPWPRRRGWSFPGLRLWKRPASRRSATRPSWTSPWPWRPPESPWPWPRRPWRPSSASPPTTGGLSTSSRRGWCGLR
jgi:hypothetical protein